MFELYLFAWMCGLTVAGLVSSLAEAAVRQRVAFAAPFVAPERLGLSLALAAFAGPAMLINSALDAYRTSQAGFGLLALAAAFANAWLLASGIVLLSLFSAVGSAMF